MSTVRGQERHDHGPEPLISLRTLVILVLATFSGVGAGIPIGLDVAQRAGVALGLISGIASAAAAIVAVAGGLHQIVSREGSSSR